jgi:hypothetical protein
MTPETRENISKAFSTTVIAWLSAPPSSSPPFPAVAPKQWKYFYLTKGSINHVERNVPKYENHKLRERKVETLTRNWRDHRTGTHNTRKLYRDILTGTAIFFNRKRVTVCEHTTKKASLVPVWVCLSCDLFNSW